MTDRLKQFYTENRDLIRFLGSAFILLVFWVMATTFFPAFINKIHYYIIVPQADISAMVLRWFGYIVDQDYMVNGCEARIVFAGGGAICVGTGCSGLELFVLFVGFIMLMPGRMKNKSWFIPLGLVAILLLNIIRIIILSVIYYHTPEYLDFNHKYTFVIIVYGAIFGLWVLWVSKFANRAKS